MLKNQILNRTPAASGLVTKVTATEIHVVTKDGVKSYPRGNQILHKNDRVVLQDGVPVRRLKKAGTVPSYSV